MLGRDVARVAGGVVGCEARRRIVGGPLWLRVSIGRGCMLGNASTRESVGGSGVARGIVDFCRKKCGRPDELVSGECRWLEGVAPGNGCMCGVWFRDSGGLPVLR